VSYAHDPDYPDVDPATGDEAETFNPIPSKEDK